MKTTPDDFDGDDDGGGSGNDSVSSSSAADRSPPLPPSRMIGFDFDLTLSCLRVYGRTHFDRLESLFGGPDRIELLRRFFAFLTDRDAVRIVVVSWNAEDVISEALERLGLRRYVHSIYDRRRMIERGGYRTGKGSILHELRTEWNLRDDDVVFVDDCREVFDSMDCRTVWVQGKAGMTIVSMKLAANKLGLTFKG